MECFTLSALLKWMGKESLPIYRADSASQFTYMHINLYIPGTEVYRYCLYLVEGTEVPEPLAKSGRCGCILVSPTGKPLAVPGQGAIETVLWDEADTLPHLLNRIQNARFAHASQSRMGTLMMSSLILAPNFQSLVQQAAAIMQNAILLLDAAYQVIAMDSLGCEVNDIFWQDALKLGRISEKNICLTKNTGMTQQLEQSSSVTLWSDADHFNHIPRLAQKIYSPQGEYLGTIAVMQCIHPFTNEDFFLLDTLVETLTTLMPHRQNLSERDRLAQEMLCLCMQKRPAEQWPKACRQYYAELRSHSFFQCGFIRLHDDPSLSRLGEYLRAFLVPQWSGAVSALLQKDLLVLFYFDEMRERCNYEERVIAKLRPLGVSIGLSPVFSDLSRFYDMHRQAVTAFDIGRRYTPSQPVHPYSDTSLMELWETVPAAVLRQYIAQTPSSALDGHSPKHTELYHTLYRFAANMGNYVETAQDLFIHKNTLLYRLNKIQSITGIDYTSHAELLHFFISAKIREYLESATPDS